MKRILDIAISLTGLAVLSPLLIFIILLIYLQDFRSPIYVAPRMRSPGRTFKMYKLRSMVANADKLGGTSTAGTDQRITAVGRFIRKWKLDEVSQLWNVLIGDMSLVGPRPQAERDASLYTDVENGLFLVKPGITDFSSIVFSDESEILAGSKNADLDYNQLIRPWKSRLGLFYVQSRSLWVDVQLIATTIIAIFSKETARERLVKVLAKLGADEDLVSVAKRESDLQPYPPPGSGSVETRY